MTMRALQCVLTAVIAASALAFTASPVHSLARSTPMRPQRVRLTMSATVEAPVADKDTRWGLWPILPLAPYGRRKTIREEVVKGKMWTFDQVQGTLYVHVPIRMTVIALETGGLLVFAPVAPTMECVRLVQELEAEFGAVQDIVLPTVAVEHKVFAGPFAQRFTKANVWVTPKQYSFPVDLPLPFLGFPLGRTKEIPDSAAGCPWEGEFDHATLGPFLSKGNGAFGETAFYHKPTKTLLCVDLIVKIPKQPPSILVEDPRPLLYHARDNVDELVENTPAVRARGWQRIALFGLLFQPSALTVVEVPECFEDAKRSPMKDLGWNGLFPFFWDPPEAEKSFKALTSGNGLLVAPILQELILNRNPQETLEWADRVAEWDFQQIVPCHLECPIKTTPADFRSAFKFLEDIQIDLTGLPFVPTPPTVLDADLELLRDANENLVNSGGVFPVQPKVPRVF